MMPYRRFHSQSRVECIKKKFENPFLEENETGSVKYSNFSKPYKINVLQELKDLNLDKNNSTKQNCVNCETHFELNDVNKIDGKPLVKRTPAFRREKLGSPKSLTHITGQKFINLSDDSLKRERNERECRSLNVQHNFLRAEATHSNTWGDIKRSKTDTNLLKYCTSRGNDKTVLGRPTLTEGSDSIDNNQNIGNCLPHYSVINTNKNNTKKKEAVNLKVSDSIRRALQSPLPKGPPPKKPPRTFCHVPEYGSQNKKNINCEIRNDAYDGVTEASKGDIPKLKLKSKLEKLEKIIKIHENGGSVKESKEGLDRLKNTNGGKTEKTLALDAKNATNSCLSFAISCLSQDVDRNYAKKSKTKSEFYFDLKQQECDSRKEEYSTGATNGVAIKVSSTEAIYDLPCVKRKNYFETFGKCNKHTNHKDSEKTKKAEESLHYMCTDVVQKTPTFSNFFFNCDRRKSVDGASHTESINSKASLLTGVKKVMSSSMSKIDGDKEFVSAVGMRTENEKEKTRKGADGFLASSSCQASSVESGLDSLITTKNLPVQDGVFGCSSDIGIKNKGMTPETEGLSEMAAERKFYLSRVSSKLFNHTPYWKCNKSDTYTHLFEYCLLVGLTLCESKQNVPYIKSIFPPDMKPPPLIESLCFPDASYWPPNSEDQQPEEQYYSLVVTNENGERKFGYCRRVLPEGGHFCLPLTYCIISPHRAGGFFYKVLEELESRHGSPGIEKFIKQLYESHFPGPGERLKLKEILEEATRITPPTCDQCLSTLVRRPCDIRLEEKHVTQLLQHLQLSVFLKVFSSLLHERKVLLLSSSLRKLSSSIEALQSVLLPFSWQHTYIPVLPVHLIEMCEAPTPYVIGLLKPKNVEKSLTNVNFEDGILVDLDESKIVKCCGDEANILPQRYTRDLKTSLNLAMNATDLSDSVRSVLLSDAFIRFFVQVCGSYSKFIVNLSTGEKIFQKDDFIKSATTNPGQTFLEWFTETAMFTSFIQERLQGEEEDMLVKLFRLRAMENSGESIKDFAAMLKNYRAINKKAKTLGDKIKDFTSFTK